MSKLLSANFSRLFKSKIFWAGMIFMFGFAAFLIIMSRIQNGADSSGSREMDSAVFAGTILIPVVTAVFSGIFLGTEYSDGTMRNKIIVGHTRASVYLSDLAVCCAGSLLMNVMFIITIIALGVPLLGMTAADTGKMIISFLIISAALCAWCAVLVFISILIHSKSAGVVTAIITGFVMMMGAIALYTRYTEPEYYPGDYMYTDSNGEITSDMVKNPGYLTGTKRKVYKTLLDLIPSGQFMQINQGSLDNELLKTLYSMSIIVVFTCGGIILFRKKDLK
ncbi:MAG: ABC transporter permease subunit [Oscillospiraceae bacterium]|nr:ABC transporter permease subunit [Oscillospiraceae bacterium]